MAGFVAALCGGPWLGGSAVAATTTYSGATGAFTIGVGDTAVLINGANITGDVLDNGTLQFNLSNNLTVSNRIAGIGKVTLTNTGTITFSGSNSYLAGTTVSYGSLVITAGGVISGSNSNSNMTVGKTSGDIGTLRVAGGRVTNYDGILGSGTASTGTAFVTSGTWANLHDLKIGLAGNGSLNISGGSVTVAGSTLLGSDATGFGALTVSGGRLDGATVLQIGSAGDGTMLVNGGSVFDVDGSIGTSASSSGTATITSGTWTNSGNLIVGFLGTGALNISNAGVVVVGDRLSKGSLGTIDLDAGGTLQIGTGGSTGTLDTDLTNNGTLLFNRSDFSNYDYLISGTGNVIKLGAGTLQLTGSNTYAGGTQILAGRIEVAGNGAIDQPSATLSIGNSSGAIGGLTVMDSGTVSTSLFDISNGDLNLISGFVHTTTARIGVFGTGTATIVGGVFGSEDSLFVGYSGTGVMDVNGGELLSREAIIGTLSGDYGAVSVTNGSVWGNGGNLTVGGAGTGVLTIADGGQVLVTGTLSKGAGGSISLNAYGTLQIGNGNSTGTLATDLTNNGLLVFNRSNDATYAGSIGGSGAVTKVGAGALTFSGSNSYSGITTIEAGSFYVNGQLGNTAVVVNPGALLGGNGTVLGSATVGSATGGTAVISPGSLSLSEAYGTLRVGSLELTSGALTRMSVSGTDAGLSYDQIAGIGGGRSLVYGGDMEIALTGSYADYTTFHLFANFTATPGTNFNSITLNADQTGPYAALSGTFTYDSTYGSSGAWVTAWTTTRQRLVFSTVTGDLIVVPEPSTLVMAAAGLGFAGLLRWRRRVRAAPTTLDQASDQPLNQP